MGKIKHRYGILVGDTYDELQLIVNEAMEDGCTLVGGVCVEPTHRDDDGDIKVVYLQAILEKE